MKTTYFGVVHKEKNSDYGVSFPDFPGCVSAGKTLEQAVTLGNEALALHIHGMVDDGEPLPEPTKADDLVHEDTPMAIFPAYAQVPRVRVKRFNIAARDADMKKIDRFLKVSGRSRDRSSFLINLALREIDKHPSTSKRPVPA